MPQTYATAKKLGQELLDNCRGVVAVQLPLYKDGEYAFPKYVSNLTCPLVASLPPPTPR